MARQYFLAKRGMVFWYEPPKYLAKTSIQQGKRPWLVVSNDEGNISAPTCNIVPMTTEDKTKIPVHVNTWINGQSNTILCEQCTTVDQNVLKEFWCFLSDDIMEKVDQALAIQFKINTVVKYADITTTNLVKKLESLIEDIILDKVEHQSQSVSYDELESSAMRLGQLIEDLVGSSKKPSVVTTTTLGDSKTEFVAPTLTETPSVLNSDSSTVCKHEDENEVKTEPDKPVKEFKSKKKNSSNNRDKNKVRTNTKWTTEARCQYLRDCDDMSPEEVRKKYGFTSVGTVFSTKYNCRNILNELGVDYKDEKAV